MPTTPGRPMNIERKPCWKRSSRCGYFRASKRGQNGYLKIRYQSIREFNAAAGQLQAALGRLFLHLGILCDIEVKGTITHKDKSGSLAKLPFSTNAPAISGTRPIAGTTRNWRNSRLVRSSASVMSST